MLLTLQCGQESIYIYLYIFAGIFCSAAMGLLKGQLVRLEKDLDVQRRQEEKLTRDILIAE